MNCTTVKPGVDCVFMTKKGCSFSGGTCHPAVEACNGCTRSTQFPKGWYCASCPDPSIKWKNGRCNLATHVKSEIKVEKTKLNPLKASKRGIH
jgi:hypothetical protein